MTLEKNTTHLSFKWKSKSIFNQLLDVNNRKTRRKNECSTYRYEYYLDVYEHILEISSSFH